ncbi:MAG: molybdopterin converting factor subunit 1 [Alphaproteobacteria bacterium]|nr:molybdopterin converting factor subunit 1 [Alphaproteobacteria bacterium]
MKILYFAWIRTKIGLSEEVVELPGDVSTVSNLLDWLRQRGPQHADALEDESVVRVAVNEEYAQLDAPISNADEVALFPPVTGG